MNRTASANLYHVYKYFEKGVQREVQRRRIVAEKSEISGAVLTSPLKQCKINIILNDFNTEEHGYVWIMYTFTHANLHLVA